MSAAGTLAASLAAAALVGVPRSRAVEVAHLAELFGRGGLGGVAAILGGGLEFRERPGIPPFGRVRHLSWSLGPIFLVRIGPPIPSPRLLGDRRWTARIEQASRGLDDLLDRPSPEDFLELSERFTERLGLGPPRVRRVVRALRRSGSWVAQAMFGNAAFAVPRSSSSRARLVQTLSRLGLPALETAAATHGARRLANRRLVEQGSSPTTL